MVDFGRFPHLAGPIVRGPVTIRFMPDASYVEALVKCALKIGGRSRSALEIRIRTSFPQVGGFEMVTKRLMTAAAIPIVAIALLSAACSIGKTKAPYEKLGEGNLKVVYLDGETYLASESVPGEGYAAAAAYKLEDGMPTPEPIEEITLRATSIVDDIDVKCLKVRGTVVSCEYGIEHSPDRTRFLFADGSGIWIADADGSNVRNLAERGFAETLDLATSVEPKIMMNWASHSKWADDRTIVFSSNRDEVPDDWSDSLWIVDT